MTNSLWSEAARQVFASHQPSDVFSLINAAYRDHEDNICLTDISVADQVQAYTWRYIRKEAARTVNMYRQLGLQKGDGVFLLTRKCVPTVIAQIACFRGGNVFVPGQVLTHDSKPEHKTSTLEDIIKKRHTLVNGGVLKDGAILVIDPELETFVSDDMRSQFRRVLTLGFDGEGTFRELVSRQPAKLKHSVKPLPSDYTYSVF